MHPGNLRMPFDPVGPFVARRRVLISGIWCGIGDFLPGGIPERRLRQMWNSRKIDVASPEEVDSAKKAEIVKRIKESVELPDNWRRLPNQQLFPLAKKLLGVQPKNRAIAFSMIQELQKELQDGVA